MAVRVASADETMESERVTIERGVAAGALMRRAGESVANIVAASPDTSSEVVVFTGSGNNGGDGWVAAECLVNRGIPARVIEVAESRAEPAREARAAALEHGVRPMQDIQSRQPTVVDALLGTGSSGSPRGAVAGAVARIRDMRSDGSRVVSIDLPSGLDATTGEHEESVEADMTVTFGAMKRGHLLARELCGRIVVTDIGLAEEPASSRLPLLVDALWVSERVPRIPPSAHKGTRKRLAVIGGGKGMAGAAILAGEGALRSGIGLLEVLVSGGNEVAVHAAIPAAIVSTWPDHPDHLERLCASADAIAIGPGLGQSATVRDLVERVLLAWPGPVVLDADALNVFSGDLLSLAQLLRGRPAAITPHPAELARLAGVGVGDVLRARFDIGLDVAAQLGAAVLLKGAPTIVFAPSGERFVSARGTAALATGGSGDVLAGMTGTLLAQMRDGGASAAEACACAAYVHGRAAELCGVARGVTLDDVLRSMPAAWSEEIPRLQHGIIAELPQVS